MIVTILKIAFLIPVTIVLSVAALAAIPLDRTGNAFRTIPRVWSRIILWIFRITVHVRGQEHLVPGQSYVYVSNHAGAFDIPAVLAAIPDEVNLIFKKELTRVPIWGWALRYGHFIMIDRANARDAMQSLDRAADAIRKGASVLLFAEGTRSTDGRLQPFKRGAFTLAAKSGKPIIPVTLNNTFRILPKGEWNVRPADIEVVLESAVQTAGKEGKTGEQQLMSAVHAAISKHYRDQS
jgi:1-acyl-sn-glycerol-3-phosphate acyltransferase